MSVPELSPAVIQELLPHLLPPSPLPQHLLSKSLLQRLTYLPPSPSDLDAHLSPFPSSKEQPISTRLRELSRGHRWSEKQYVREDEDIFARMIVEREEGGEGVEVLFEWEGGSEGSEGRGWVYHSARLPSISERNWVASPALLPPPISAVPKSSYDDADDPYAAPAGYWSAFDDEPLSDIKEPGYESDHVGAEDDYWAQYSRPATAPITPGTHTPGLYHAHSESNANNVPHPHAHNGLASYFQKTRPSVSQERLKDIDETAVKLHESLTKLGLDPQNGGLTLASLSLEPKGIWRETGDDVRAKVAGKIGSGLNDIWRQFVGESEGEEKEEKAMEWLRLARPVVDPLASPIAINRNLNGEKVVAKLEVLKDMYELLNEAEEEQGFWRMVEGVIRKSSEEEGMEDEVTRQQMYYE
ncbi:hypothetical protein IAS59_006113 [Cryptococcus gattii]